MFRNRIGFAVVMVVACTARIAVADGVVVPLTAGMVEAVRGDAALLVDEQKIDGAAPTGTPSTIWHPGWKPDDHPAEAVLDLGQARELVAVWLFDLNGSGKFDVASGQPGAWTVLFTEGCEAYQAWKAHPVDVTTRYLRLRRLTPGANVAEIVVFERSPAEKQARADAARRPLVDAGPPFGPLPLVDEIDCGVPPAGRLFTEEPPGASHMEAILGRSCRVLTNAGDQPKFFAYRIAQGKYLEPGKTYLLAVEFPEDQPRTMYLLNRGCETALGVHTGRTVGDALHAKYVWSNPESLEIPLSNEYRTWRMFFCLHDRFPEIGAPRGEGPRPLTPSDGFPVIVAQPAARDAPLSAGAAVARIRLFAVPDPARFDAKYTPPPDGLPRRHLFFREEMSDGVVQSRNPLERGVTDTVAWFEYKARLMRFLGIDSYAKDLLEFGHNQGWDAGPGWYNQTPFPDRWPKVLKILQRYGLSALPYYEYCGGIGPGCLGVEKRCRPLGDQRDYTHITWSEIANADVTDPATLAEAKKLLDYTITRYKDAAPFVGAWFRPRVSGMPISFSDRCLGLFVADVNQGVPVTRDALKADAALMARYHAWWLGKRRDFLTALADHLRQSAGPDAVLLFTTDTSEPGISFDQWNPPMVAEDPAPWRKIGEKAVGLDEVVRDGWFTRALTAPRLTWDKWEWQHACPRNDPENYANTPGVLLTYSFNRAYTVASPEALEAFRGPAGLAAVRHFCLNEDVMGEKLGYFVCDVERAGPYSMLAEARAVAHGDPFYLGAFASSSFNRGFPEYARAFYTAFLSLPALPSEVLAEACSDPAVVVRAIRTERHGTYLAVVNTGYQEADISVKLPAPGAVSDAPSGATVESSGGAVRLRLYPCQLKALRIETTP